MSINRQSGLTMIEILVTLAITTVGLLGLSAMQFQSVQSVQDSGNRSHAIWVINDVVNRMRANEAADYVTQGELGCNNAPAKICSAYHNGNNRVQADATCTPDEVALSDMWEALCGTPLVGADGTISNGSGSMIVNPRMSITDVGDDKQITISWTSRVSGNRSDGNGGSERVYAIDDGELSNDQRESYTTVIRP